MQEYVRRVYANVKTFYGFPSGLVVKESACNAGVEEDV